jgi:hypothetical protein
MSVETHCEHGEHIGNACAICEWQAGRSFAEPACSVNCPRELFEWLTEYAIDLSGEYAWRRNSTPRNNEMMAKLDAHIKEAVALRDSPNVELTHSGKKTP